MKRGEVLEQVKCTITQDRNNRHGEPENSFPLIAARWSEYLGVTVKPSDVAELMALFKDVRFSVQPENPDNKHDQIGYLAIACELRAIENTPITRWAELPKRARFRVRDHLVHAIINENDPFPEANNGVKIGYRIGNEIEVWQRTHGAGWVVIDRPDARWCKPPSAPVQPGETPAE